MAAKNERALIELFAPAASEALGSTASARFEEATLRPAGARLHVSHMEIILRSAAPLAVANLNSLEILLDRSCSAASASEAFDRASQN